MWLRRTGGGLLEVVDGVETTRGEPFEVADEKVAKQLLKREDFEEAPKTVAKKAEAAARNAEPVATGPGGIPADEVKTTKTTGPVKPVARRGD